MQIRNNANSGSLNPPKKSQPRIPRIARESKPQGVANAKQVFALNPRSKRETRDEACKRIAAERKENPINIVHRPVKINKGLSAWKPLRLENHVPVPEVRWLSQLASRYQPALKAKVGESFWVENHNKRNQAMHWLLFHGPNMQFNSRRVRRGYRIWRTA
jgi:hypothetical protein